MADTCTKYLGFFVFVDTFITCRVSLIEMESYLTTPPSHNQRTPQRDKDPPLSPLTRTAEQVSKAAQTAGLTNTRGPVQLLQFSSSLNSDEIKLLETPPDVLTSLSKGQTYVYLNCELKVWQLVSPIKFSIKLSVCFILVSMCMLKNKVFNT